MLSTTAVYRLIDADNTVSYVTGVCVFDPSPVETMYSFPEGSRLYVMSSSSPRGMEAFYGINPEDDGTGTLHSVEILDLSTMRGKGVRWIFQRMTAEDLYAAAEPPVSTTGPLMNDAETQTVVSSALVIDDFAGWLSYKTQQQGYKLLNL